MLLGWGFLAFCLGWFGLIGLNVISCGLVFCFCDACLCLVQMCESVVCVCVYVCMHMVSDL